VKIKGVCRRCGREFIAEQVIDNGGRCPWDGEPMQPDYAATFVEALRAAVDAGNALEEALDRLADLHPALVLENDSVLASLQSSLDRLEQTPVEQP
jgi:hypothetical protein